MKKNRREVLSRNLALLYHFAIRELKVRYKSPLLGFLWMFFVPLSLAIIFKLVFSVIVKVPIPEYPFFIFLILGVFPWNFLALSISSSVNSLVDNEALLKKVYFQREIIPLSIVLGNLINFVISNLIIILITAGSSEVTLSKFIIFLPLLIVIQTLFVTGLGLIFSSLQVYYRDIKYLTEILLLFWFYISPIFYPLKLVAEVSDKFLKAYLLNPLASLIPLYRIIYLENYIDSIPAEVSIAYLVSYALVSSLLICGLGFLVFSKLKKRFTDFV